MINQFEWRKLLFAPETRTLFASFIFGLLSAVTFSFHIQIAQNLIFSEKVLFILFFTTPFMMVFKLLFNEQCVKIGLWSKIVQILISVGVTAFIFILFYQPVLPVQYHELTIYYPPATEGEKAAFFKISKVEIENIITRNIPISSLHKEGKYKYLGNDPAFYPESLISYKKQFLGDLIFYPSPSDCPLIVDVKYDDIEQKMDLCDINTADGYVFDYSNTRSITKRWMILIDLVKVIDFILLSTALFFLPTVFHKWSQLVISSIKNRKHISIKLSLEVRLLTIGLIIGGFPLATILLTGYTNLFLFFPLIFIVCFLLTDYLGVHLPYKSLPIMVTCILLTGIIFNIVSSQKLSSYRLPYKDPIRIQSNSYNDLVTSKFRGFTSSISLGYRDVTHGRKLNITVTAYQAYDFTSIFNEKGNFGLESINRLYESKTLSTENLEFLLNQKHTKWDDKDGHNIIFIDISLYKPEEPIVLDYINGLFIFYPESIFEQVDM